MKKAFFQTIQSLTNLQTTDSEPAKKKRKKSKTSQGQRNIQRQRGNGPEGIRNRALNLEFLEDRSMLSAAAITFDTPDTFIYSPSTSGEYMNFPLERTDFLQVGKINRGGDIISVDQSKNTVSVFLNSGATTNQFSASVDTELSKIGGAKKFAVADMNGDGVDDLIVLYTALYTSVGSPSSVDLFIDVYNGNQNGTFSKSETSTHISNVFTVDGMDDFYIETFQVRDVVKGSGESSSVAYPDLTVTLTAASSNTVLATGTYLFIGQSGNKFSTSPITVSGSSEDVVGFGYVTSNQSSLQLITETNTVNSSNLNVQSLQYYNATLSSSSASITAAGKYTYEPATSLWNIVANADRDTRDEIITGINYISSASVLSYGVRVTHVDSLSSGTSNISASTNLYSTDISPRFGTVGDMNNDGIPDILISDGTSYQFLKGTTSGFTVESKIDSYANYLASQVGDFDGDGYQDVIAVGERQIMFLPGNPSHPNYGTGRVVVSLTFRATNAVFGDFTGDGLLDIAIASGTTSGGSTVIIYQGITNTAAPGSETLFERYQVIEEVTSPSALAVGHFVYSALENPVKMDLAILGESGTIIHVFSFDNGQREWYQTPLNSAMLPAVHLAAGDFGTFYSTSERDRETPDGYDDVIIANEQKGNITILFNQGNGIFERSPSITINVGDPVDNTKVPPTGSRPSFVATADINGDGLLDFAVLNAGDNQIKFYTQNSSSASDRFSNTDSISSSGWNLMSSARNYQMIFEDFDRDGRIDLIVGVTETKRVMVFQNKGSQAGKFDNTVNWVTSADMVLDGSSGQYVLWSMSTGYVRGHKNDIGYDAQTPGVVVVSGNRVYRIANTTDSEVSSGTMEMVFREYASTSTIDSGQYDAIPARTGTEPIVTWLNEWGHYYLEVWGSTGSSSDELASFTCTMNYDASLFATTNGQIASSSNFSLTTATVNVAQETITVAGTSTRSNLGADQYVLLFRIYVSPAVNTAGANEKENVGVSIPEFGYAVPVDSGFSFVASTVQMNQKNLANLIDGEKLPVYPVIYDVNDRGYISTGAYSLFVGVFGESGFSSDSIYCKYDFVRDEYVAISTADYNRFVMAFGKERSATAHFPHSLFPDNFPAAWENSAAAASMAATVSVSSGTQTLLKTVADVEPISTMNSIIESTINQNSSLEAPFETVNHETQTPTSTTTDSSLLLASVSSGSFTVSDSFGSALSISELDTLGYTSRIESGSQSKSTTSERIDYVLGELFAMEEQEDDAEELLLTAAGNSESNLWGEKIFSDWD